MIGSTANSLNIRDGKRVTAADAWLTPSVRARGNLRILTGSQVRRLALDGNRVSRLEIMAQHGQMEVSGAQVILCAGSLEARRF
jgi:choline dehydrogenase-like flavoprotein